MKQTLVLFAVLALFSGSALAQKKPTPKTKTAPAAALGGSVLKGKSIYTQNCLSCHQADGLGVDGMNPPLSKTSYVLGDKARLVNVLLHGMQGQEVDGERYANVMAAHDFLTDQQIADVLTYVRSSFGNKAPAVTMTEVKAVRAAAKK